MGNTRWPSNINVAILRLLEIAESLIRELGIAAGTTQQVQALAHISCRLILADKVPHNLGTAFLDEVEALCTWPNRPNASDNSRQRYQTLLGIAVEPKLWLWKDPKTRAKRGLLAYAECTAEEQETLQFFRRRQPYEFVENSDAKGLQYEGDDQEEIKLPDDFPDFVMKDVYQALSEYSSCNCSNPQASERRHLQHEARLRLTGRTSLSDGFAVFDMHFLSSLAVPPDQNIGHWQQLRLRINSKRLDLKRVRFGNNTGESNDSYSSSEAPSPIDKNEPLSKKDFCRRLRKDSGPVKICLQVQGQQLFDREEPDPTDQKLARELSVPLSQVLNSHDLTSKMKLGLAYTLARSVWQYYDSDWTKASWTCESIQFMREIRPTAAQLSCITCRPFFAVRFKEHDDVLPEYCDPEVSDLELPHRYPRILALGALLLNIGSGAHSQIIDQGSYNLEQRINEEFFWCREVISDTTWPRIGLAGEAGEYLRTLYRDATSACFDRDLFQACDSCRKRKVKCPGKSSKSCKKCTVAGLACTYNAGRRSGEKASLPDAQFRRKLLLDHVVDPLHKALRLVNWEDSLDSSEAIPLKSTRKSIKRPLSQSQYTRHRNSRFTGQNRRMDEFTELDDEPYDSARFYDDERLHENDLDHKSDQYVGWKEMFIKTAELFEKPESKSSPRPIEIAVLDTGLYKTHKDIEYELDRIWVYNRVENCFNESENSEITDLKGHGTHVVGLVLEYAPDAHVYVADVTVKGTADPSIIASAIRCAVDRNVDIISISFGFPKRRLGDALEKAIEYAYKKNVHVFAAASNKGGNAKRAYPARYDTVFCIHSTDTDGDPSKFNPTDDPEDVNFATVGEAVESSWPKHLREMVETSDPNDANVDAGDAGDEIENGEEDAEEDAEEKPSIAVKSGTSFATPIAACIAAFLLRYAQIHLEPEHVEQLKRRSVMKSVLKRVGDKRKGFYYLTLRSDPDHLFGLGAGDIRSAIETAITQSG
ncbi:hypothetical protein GQ44DRAFT_779049 [Phaeosphaeriaceae sp. PMI808]|nr:hypothetical protein GQ44DRAFT_779049 [Phaeosphaeriaceae sp. PMI808]